MADIDRTQEILIDEYKILQDKIDKIGAFRVTIKGWAVTATGGGLFAATSGKGISPVVTGLALTIMLGFFFRFERTQVKRGWLFNKRALRIEMEIDKLRRQAAGNRLFSSDLQDLFSTPQIAREIFGAGTRQDLFVEKWECDELEKIRPRLNEELHLARSAEMSFYWVLIGCSWYLTQSWVFYAFLCGYVLFRLSFLWVGYLRAKVKKEEIKKQKKRIAQRVKKESQLANQLSKGGRNG